MRRKTTLNGEQMSLAEAVAQIINNQINELVLRCIKTNEVRHYYDIAVIGYGENAYSGWNGALAGRDFVSPEELKNNPYKRITIKEEKRTRKGVQIKEAEKVRWIEARRAAVGRTPTKHLCGRKVSWKNGWSSTTTNTAIHRR